MTNLTKSDEREIASAAASRNITLAHLIAVALILNQPKDSKP